MTKTEASKQCTGPCKKTYPVEEFSRRGKYLRSYCRRCQRARHFYRKYGITHEQYDELLKKQNGVCAICHEAETMKNKVLAVDHDHATGIIRGLLCHRCNIGIGYFRERIELFKEAARYLGVAYDGDDDDFDDDDDE